jgi:putative oxidoreductase
MLTLRFLGRFRDFGLLVMRVGLGLAYIVHGAPKMLGGPAMWAKVGGAMGGLGVTFMPALWGFLASFAEFGGGVLLILGFLFRPAAVLLFCTMAVATITLYQGGQEFGAYSHPLKMAFVFFGLIFIGPGRFSIDRD